VSKIAQEGGMEKVKQRAEWRLRALENLATRQTAYGVFEAIGDFITAIGSELCSELEVEQIVAGLRRVPVLEARVAAWQLLHALRAFRLSDPTAGREEFEKCLWQYHQLASVWAGLSQWCQGYDVEELSRLSEYLRIRMEKRFRQIEAHVAAHPKLSLDKTLVDRLCLEEDTFPSSLSASM
jgi:hypothetical protein